MNFSDKNEHYITLHCICIYISLIHQFALSASNFVSILKKLLHKPTKCYRKPSEMMPWAKAKRFYGTNASRTDERLTSLPATFSYSPRWSYSWKGVILTWLRRSTQNRKRISTHSYLRTSRDAWNMGNMLGSLYTCPRGLLQRRWWKLGVTITNFFLWSDSPNFLVTPCMLTSFVGKVCMYWLGII
jgi:hypothetical protein